MDLLDSRIRTVRETSTASCGSVLYVMSRDQRLIDNAALVAAQREARKHKLPLAVVFVLSRKGVRSREQYQFMLNGLQGVERDLHDLNIPLLILLGNPPQVLSACFEHVRPKAVFFDFSPLKSQKNLLQHLTVLDNAPSIKVVDTHNIVPVWEASDKLEVGARTIRKKLHAKLDLYLREPLYIPIKHPHPWPGTVQTMSDLGQMIDDFLVSVPPSGVTISVSAGSQAARDAVNDFVLNRLSGYSINRNDPSIDVTSRLSPYLHFGHISSREVILSALMHSGPNIDTDTLIEEMVVRKELSDNFCYYQGDYRSLKAAPEWAQRTLMKHTTDPREFMYSLEELKSAQTHDTAWNAAQRQLLVMGYMHGYMRMYWAKKVLEWTSSPEEALRILHYLNDFYSLDGGDPNGYVGILWSVCGVHDRPWGERPIYGTIRSMVYSGLKRKFNIKAYEEKWLP